MVETEKLELQALVGLRDDLIALTLCPTNSGRRVSCASALWPAFNGCWITDELGLEALGALKCCQLLHK